MLGRGERTSRWIIFAKWVVPIRVGPRPNDVGYANSLCVCSKRNCFDPPSQIDHFLQFGKGDEWPEILSSDDIERNKNSYSLSRSPAGITGFSPISGRDNKWHLRAARPLKSHSTHGRRWSCNFIENLRRLTRIIAYDRVSCLPVRVDTIYLTMPKSWSTYSFSAYRHLSLAVHVTVLAVLKVFCDCDQGLRPGFDRTEVFRFHHTTFDKAVDIAQNCGLQL